MAPYCFELVKSFGLILLLTPAGSELTLESVKEGQCVMPEAIRPDLIRCLTFLFRLALPVNKYYVPMGSKYMVRWYAKQLLGRDAQSQEELDKMKLRITGSMGTWWNEGFPDYPTKYRFLQQGWFTIRNPFSTFRYIGVNGVVESIIRRKNDISVVRETVIWTDYRTIVLFYRCVDGSPDFKLVSLRPTIPEDVRDLVVSEVLRLGFNESMIEHIKY